MNRTNDHEKRVRPLFALVVYPLIVVGGVALDLGTKHWAFASLGMPGEFRWQTEPELHGIHWLWNGVFGFQTSLNQGALFGMGAGTVRWLAVLSLIALIGILGWLAHSAWKSRVLTTTLGMISAGILGNLHDRLGLHGLHWNYADDFHRIGEPVYAVRDWILVMLGSYHWPNFNIADALLVCGTILLVLLTLFEKEPVEKQSEPKQSEPKQSELKQSEPRP